MSKATVVIGFVLVLAFAYPVAMRILAVRLQPTRIKMLKLGEELLESPALNTQQKAVIRSMLSDTFSPRFMLMAALIVPIYVIARVTVLRRPLSPLTIVPNSVTESVQKLQNYHLRAVATANPICTLIVIVEVVLLWLPLRLLGMMDGNSNSHGNVRADARNLASEIEARRSHAF